MDDFADAPGFPMHEVAGEVIASKARHLSVGDKVAGWADDFNGLAEYVVTNGKAVVAYDPRLTPDVAVCLQPLACVLDAARRIPGLPSRDVVILGVGPIGLLFGHVLKSLGARSVLGVDRIAREDLAPDFGFDGTMQLATNSWLSTLDDADRPDIVVEAIGHQQSTFGHAVEALAPEGLLYYFGVPDDINYSVPVQTLLRKNLTVMAGITLRKPLALGLANEYLAENPSLPDRYITHRIHVSDATRAYSLAATPATGQAKIILDMTR
jgi:threonine dehydrogenase-like Zn-dependent dehydrogenase